MSEKKQKNTTEDKIINAYIEYLLENGTPPPSVFKFMKDMRWKESTFYNHFNSFNALENFVWLRFITDTTDTLLADENYAAFSGREKLLSFFYTFIEVIKKNRSFVLMRMKGEFKPGHTPSYLKGFKEAFKEFVDELINEGKETGEIAPRKYIDRTYTEAFWVQLMFIINFWACDDSRNFEKTDEAIERAVNLSFEMIGEGPLEQMFDFAKFLYQNR